MEIVPLSLYLPFRKPQAPHHHLFVVVDDRAVDGRMQAGHRGIGAVDISFEDGFKPQRRAVLGGIRHQCRQMRMACPDRGKDSFGQSVVLGTCSPAPWARNRRAARLHRAIVASLSIWRTVSRGRLGQGNGGDRNVRDRQADAPRPSRRWHAPRQCGAWSFVPRMPAAGMEALVTMARRTSSLPSLAQIGVESSLRIIAFLSARPAPPRRLPAGSVLPFPDESGRTGRDRRK